MQPKVGPFSARALSLIENGPLPTEAIARQLWTFGAPKDGPRGRNRVAGGTLGRLERWGFVATDGERWHITENGRAKLAEAREQGIVHGEDFADNKPGPGKKHCPRCNAHRPKALFSPRPHHKDGLSSYCKPCINEWQAEKREGQIIERDADLAWTRTDKAVLVARVTKLLAAARNARREGMWRGREAIRAYKDLGLALDGFRNANDRRLVPSDAIVVAIPDCTCPESWPCPRHAPEVQAAGGVQ